MSREELVRMAKHMAACAAADRVEQTPDVLRVPARNYLDEDRARLEREKIFKRLPLMLAMSCELPKAGDYRALEAAGVPVLIARGADGGVRAFLNSCAHRGAQIVTEASGNTRRFMCPYHAWTYDLEGRLAGVFQEKDFGTVERATHGLVRLPALERAGLIWVILDPKSQLSIEKFLCGYDALLAHFGFESWHFHSRRSVKGPNWKIAYDGYLDFYHLPILHRNTFGTEIGNRALYYAWGPHQRVLALERGVPSSVRGDGEPASAETNARASAPPEEWPLHTLLTGVWTIFPHVSIASFDAGGRGVMISQLFPGESPLESITVQNYLMEKPPTDEQRAVADKMFELLGFVVREEDYATGLRQQRALQSGARTHVLFGRNEGGGQRFHGTTERLLALADDELAREFA
jgi:phenylpropionate dioxygenase-like ring-hydroxylating dioxygenase large terminal subunit